MGDNSMWIVLTAARRRRYAQSGGETPPLRTIRRRDAAATHNPAARRRRYAQSGGETPPLRKKTWRVFVDCVDGGETPPLPLLTDYSRTSSGQALPSIISLGA